jgi:hypothetical protein
MEVHMKRLLIVTGAASLLVAASFVATQAGPPAKPATAARASASHSTAAAQQGTWKGEVLDAGCYLGHGAMGPKHKECALKCASNGMPLMLMVGDKAVLLTPNHDNADPYEAIKGWAGSVVEVTGTMSTRSGVSGIDVTGARLAASR